MIYCFILLGVAAPLVLVLTTINHDDCRRWLGSRLGRCLQPPGHRMWMVSYMENVCVFLMVLEKRLAWFLIWLLEGHFCDNSGLIQRGWVFLSLAMFSKTPQAIMNHYWETHGNEYTWIYQQMRPQPEETIHHPLKIPPSKTTQSFVDSKPRFC